MTHPLQTSQFTASPTFMENYFALVSMNNLALSFIQEGHAGQARGLLKCVLVGMNNLISHAKSSSCQRNIEGTFESGLIHPSILHTMHLEASRQFQSFSSNQYGNYPYQKRSRTSTALKKVSIRILPSRFEEDPVSWGNAAATDCDPSSEQDTILVIRMSPLHEDIEHIHWDQSLNLDLSIVLHNYSAVHRLLARTATITPTKTISDNDTVMTDSDSETDDSMDSTADTSSIADTGNNSRHPLEQDIASLQQKALQCSSMAYSCLSKYETECAARNGGKLNRNREGMDRSSIIKSLLSSPSTASNATATGIIPHCIALVVQQEMIRSMAEMNRR